VATAHPRLVCLFSLLATPASYMLAARMGCVMFRRLGLEGLGLPAGTLYLLLLLLVCPCPCSQTTPCVSSTGGGCEGVSSCSPCKV
jgi:hypothetical protein